LQIGDFGLAENFDENAQANWGKRQSLRRTGTKGFFAPVRLFPPFPRLENRILTYSSGAILEYLGKAGLSEHWYRRPIVGIFFIIFTSSPYVLKIILFYFIDAD
jgi:hypothetical protein